jgi:chromosome segregation ATPase
MATKRTTNLKIAERPAPLSPERERLRAAIVSRDELKCRIAGIVAAADSTMRESWDLDTQLEAARTEISGAQKREVSGRVAKAMNRPAQPGLSLAEAKSAVANLEEQVETCRLTRKALEAELETAQSKLGSVTSDIQVFASAVIWSDPSTLRLLADLELAIKTKNEAWAAVQALGVLPNDKQHFAVINKPVDTTKAAAWEQWRKSLESDAGAMPPS